MVATAAPTALTTELRLRSPDATWTRERWETLPEDGNRYEVIDGVLYMSTAPRTFHQWIIQRALFAIHEQVDAHALGFTFVAPIGVFMPGCSPVQPDLVVVRAADREMLRGGRVEGVPALILEVQSPSSVGYDDRTKRQAYARAGLPEYWIARPPTRDVLLCTHPDPALGDYADTRLVAADQELASTVLPIRFPVERLFAGAPDTTL
jgi:Uma2 family endonuclease